MTVRIARMGACLAAAAALVVGVSACSAGQASQTAETVAAVPGANAQVGDLMLNDVKVAFTSPDGYAAGQSANLFVRIFNNGTAADTLTGVTVNQVQGTGDPSPTGPVTLVGGAAPGASTAPSAGTSGAPGAGAPSGSSTISVEVGPAQYVMLVPPSLDATVVSDGRYLQVSGLSSKLTPGQNLNMTFTFAHAGTVTMDVPMGIPAVPEERSKAEFPNAEEH